MSGQTEVSTPATSWLRQACQELTRRTASPARAQINTAFENAARALARETELTAQCVAASCSIANAADNGIAVALRSELDCFPERPKVFPSALLGLTPIYLDRDTANALSALHASAALAIEFSRGGPSANGQTRTQAQSNNAALVWRTTARHAIEAVAQAETFLLNTGAAYRLPDTEQLIACLTAVEKGSVIGVAADGSVVAPRIREDRHFTRYLKSIPATIISADKSTPVMIRDISQGGCGFDSSRRFQAGEVTLILGDQSSFTGNVVWLSGLSGGLQFSQPITESDAMFAGERSA